MSSVSKFNEETRQAVLANLRCGCWLEQACLAAGISKESFDLWKQMAKEGIRNNTNAEYVTFINQCEAVMAEVEIDAARRANIANPAWWLSRSYARERWREAKEQIADGEDKPTEININVKRRKKDASEP